MDRIELHSKVGIVIRWYREGSGITQTELSEKSGIPRKILNLIEEGRGYHTLTTYHKIALALDISLHLVMKHVEESTGIDELLRTLKEA